MSGAGPGELGALRFEREAGAYRVRMATAADDVRAAQRLRFEVFNLELKEGLSASYETGLDRDPFDDVCDHLLVEEMATRLVVGTYRLQTGASAAAHLGYYSEQEFDFTPFDPARSEVIELGRACVHAQHRKLSVVSLLWKGIAAYARWHGARYLVGCSSLTSQDPRDGTAMFRHFEAQCLADPEWRTVPRPAFACPALDRTWPAPRVPKLLAAYLSIGARICGPPAIDREFKTIDFLTFLDLKSLPAPVVEKYLI
jgi:putative hemolysin